VAYHPRSTNRETIERRYTDALVVVVGQVRRDSSVLAAILCGSLSHDTVCEKSDIDLVLVTIDDKRVPASDIALSADGIDVHAILMPRAEFRKTVEGSLRNSFEHSLLAKGRLLYTHDPTIADRCDTLHTLGSRDTAVRLLQAESEALSCLDKARKWLVTCGDVN
jgi:predicted nucleotidyltransferase